MNSVWLRSKYVSPYPELAAKWVVCKLALTVQVPVSIPGHQLGKKQAFLSSEDSSTEYWQTLLCNLGAKYFALSKLKSFLSFWKKMALCAVSWQDASYVLNNHCNGFVVWFLLIITFPVKVSEEKGQCTYCKTYTTDGAEFAIIFQPAYSCTTEWVRWKIYGGLRRSEIC